MIRSIFDTLFSVCLLIGSVFLYFVADTFPRFEKYKNIDSDFWPKIILIIVFFLSLGLLYQNIVTFRKTLNRQKKESDSVPENEADKVNWIMFGLMSLFCCLYFIGLQTVGFIISTVLFLIVSVTIIGTSGKIIKFVFPIVFTFLVAFLFVKVLDLSLPRGIGIFREFSLLFY